MGKSMKTNVFIVSRRAEPTRDGTKKQVAKSVLFTVRAPHRKKPKNSDVLKRLRLMTKNIETDKNLMGVPLSKAPVSDQLQYLKERLKQLGRPEEFANVQKLKKPALLAVVVQVSQYDS